MAFEIRQLTKRYGNLAVLDIHSARFKKGAIYGLLGPNGAGKSTLLRILAFLERPTSGQLTFDGQPVVYTNGALTALRRRVGLVHQHPILFTASVSQNIDFGLRIRGISRPQRKERIYQALAHVGLQDLADYPAHQLSGGQTQRVALARAWALNPEVLLCDEPCASVDVEHQLIVRQILLDINRSLGTTIIFTTHDPEEAERLAQEIRYLDRGQLGVRPPQNVFVACKSGDPAAPLGTIRIAERFDLILAAPLPQSTDFQIHIDPTRIRLHKQPQTGCQAGRLRSLQVVENDWVELTIDVDISLVVRMPANAFRDLNADLLDTLWVRIPTDALSVVGSKAP